MSEPILSINAVVQRTGLSAHVIRIWEKRYRAVEPSRTATKRRLYSEDDVERLQLLHEITRAGQSIGYVAKLPTEQLRTLLESSLKSTPPSPPETGLALLDRGVAAATGLDTSGLETVLREADIAFGLQGMLQKFIAPFTRQIGELWRAGDISAAHEHFATAIVRAYLTRALRANAVSSTAPLLVVATPSGQHHELGALLVAAGASNLGWQITYLGASLPAAEIAGAVRQLKARAVALSIVYPEDDPNLRNELVRLSELIPAGTALLIGGRAALSYQEAILKAGALLIPDLASLGTHLDTVRRPSDEGTQ